MSWLEEDRKGESNCRYYVTDAPYLRQTGEPLIKKKKWCDITSPPQPQSINKSSITSTFPRQQPFNTMAALNRSVSREGCWGRRNWNELGNRGKVEGLLIVIG